MAEMSGGSTAAAVAMIVIFGLGGALLVAIPHRIREVAYTLTEGRKKSPISRVLVYDAVRRPGYVLQLRLSGAVMILMAILLALILRADLSY